MHDARDRNAGIWIEPSDRLYVAAYSSVASLAVRFSGYFRRANGEVSQYAVTLNPTNDRAITASDVFFGEGFLLSCVAHLASGNANRGQCYVRAEIQRGTGTPAVKLAGIVGGYVSDDYSPSFPFGQVEGPLEGPGNLRAYAGTDQAAGAEISETVPTGARWKILALRFSLVASGDVANRYVGFYSDNGTTGFLYTPPAAVQTAGVTYTYAAAGYGYPSNSIDIVLTINFPTDWYLPAGYRFGTFTASLHANDNFGIPQVFIEEWIEA